MVKWTKTISVDKKIVPLLSEATYTDIYQVIREFVNNGYDADATRIDIDIDLSVKNNISIHDNGHGMTERQFETDFLRIARTSKKTSNRTEYGRPTIGKFGIGYLSATRFCKFLIIESTVEGSSEIFEAVINCEEFLKPGEKLVGEIPVFGMTKKKPSKNKDSYTRITLQDLTSNAIDFFDTKKEKKQFRKSIRGWEGIESLKWKLQQVLPLEYEDSEKNKEYFKVLKSDFGLPLEVYLNGEKLHRNPLIGDVVSNDRIVLNDRVSFKYVICTPWKSIKPLEQVGLQIRLNNVGVGNPDLFGASFLTGHLYTVTKWVCGEIILETGLENDINISRNDFNETEDYDDFFNFFHAALIKAFNYIETNKPSLRKIAKIEKELNNNTKILKKRQEKQEKTSPTITKKIIASNLKPSEDYVSKIVQELGKPGLYNIQKTSYSGKVDQKPIELDRKSKKIKIVDNHPAFKEYIFIENFDFIVEYVSWEIPEELDSIELEDICRIDKQESKIFLNKDFVLFHDSKYGKIYKEIFSILQYVNTKYQRSKDTNNYIAKIIIEKFIESGGIK